MSEFEFSALMTMAALAGAGLAAICNLIRSSEKFERFKFRLARMFGLVKEPLHRSVTPEMLDIVLKGMKK